MIQCMHGYTHRPSVEWRKETTLCVMSSLWLLGMFKTSRTGSLYDSVITILCFGIMSYYELPCTASEDS